MSKKDCWYGSSLEVSPCLDFFHSGINDYYNQGTHSIYILIGKESAFIDSPCLLAIDACPSRWAGIPSSRCRSCCADKPVEKHCWLIWCEKNTVSTEKTSWKRRIISWVNKSAVLASVVARPLHALATAHKCSWRDAFSPSSQRRPCPRAPIATVAHHWTIEAAAMNYSN
jgi:hypothetical protein